MQQASIQFYYKVELTRKKRALSVFGFIVCRSASIFLVALCPLRFVSFIVLVFVLSQLFVQLVAMGGIDPAVVVLDLLALFEPEFFGIKLDGIVVRNLDMEGDFGHVL